MPGGALVRRFLIAAVILPGERLVAFGNRPEHLLHVLNRQPRRPCDFPLNAARVGVQALQLRKPVRIRRRELPDIAQMLACLLQVLIHDPLHARGKRLHQRVQLPFRKHYSIPSPGPAAFSSAFMSGMLASP